MRVSASRRDGSGHGGPGGGVDIWCGEVKTHLQAEQDPQVKHLNAITSYDHPVAGTAKVVAPAVKLSKTPPQIERPAPLVGQHYHEILHEYGFSDAEIAAWSAHGTVEQSR